jgi:hypothetical protein
MYTNVNFIPEFRQLSSTNFFQKHKAFENNTTNKKQNKFKICWVLCIYYNITNLYSHQTLPNIQLLVLQPPPSAPSTTR